MPTAAVRLARQRAAKSALDRHVALALEGCRNGQADWVLWAHNGAYLASTLAEDIAPEDARAATGFYRVGKVLRGAAASQHSTAVDMLRDAAAYVSAA
jgi:hypothetical protein